MRRRRAVLARQLTASLNGTAELMLDNLTPYQEFHPRSINGLLFANRVDGFPLLDAEDCGVIARFDQRAGAQDDGVRVR